MSSSVPQHVGLILDGNRRWAQEKGLPTLQGHRRGYENLKVIAEEAFKSGIKYVSAFCFSTENWNRSKEEVSYLMDLAAKLLSRDARKMVERGVRIVVFGVSDNMSEKLVEDSRRLVEDSKNNTKGTLIICLNYGGGRELADAVKAIVKEGITADEITEQTISNYVYSPDIPPIDLLIRTGGEQRISNFMLWRVAYSELYFEKKYWPDFDIPTFHKALDEFASRQRRFGK